MRRLGTLPLIHQPGKQWMYTTGSHVLGVLIARVAGQPLSSFLQERIFAPLGMVDTAFHVPEDKLSRLATCYRVNPTNTALEVQDGVADSQWSQPPSFPDGAAGLVSSADDFLAFGRMLLDKGTHGHTRILSRASVDLMTTDQLTPDQKSDFAILVGSAESRGWGFGMSVVTARDQISATPGQFGWDGGFGTSWRSDPAEGLVGILLTQRLLSPVDTGIDRDFWTGVYAALDD